MTRYSSVDELVILPRMSAADGIALGTALEAAALAVMGGPTPQPLPTTIAPKFQRMVAARDGLAAAARGRMPSDDETPQSKAADQVLDSMWSGTRDLCNAYRKLPRNERTAPLIESAEILWQAFFSADGLEFTKIKYRLQWVESKHRLDTVADKSLATHFNRLGAGIFLTELQAAQAAYGQALGLTEASPEEDTGAVRSALTALQAGVKRYIAAAHGYADPDIPGSQELIEKLLAPLNTWKSSSATSAADDEPESEDPTTPDIPVPEPA